MKTTILFTFTLLLTLSLPAQQSHLSLRPSFSLNGQWNYIVDPYENGFYSYRYEPFDNSGGIPRSAYFSNTKPADKSDLIEYDFDRSDTIAVPSDWNTQKERLFYYEGTVWYKKSFDHRKKNVSDRLFLTFGAVNYQADVYLNGKKLGVHVGGFTPFNYEITDLVRERDNFLIVKVDNKRKKEGVPTLNTDWWNYGGITRDVKIVETPGTYIQNHVLQLDRNDGTKINGTISIVGPDAGGKNVTVEIPELSIKKQVLTDKAGTAVFEIMKKKIVLWSPENPKLYTVIVSTENDRITDRVGFRTIKTSGAKILLNDKPLFLRGMSIHEESPFTKGRGHSSEDAKQLLLWAKELGCNFVRLAHYPHNENMVRLADSMGILVWEEIPVYWTIAWNNAETYLNAEEQLSAIIGRDRNRASVIIWSMANETPVSDLRNHFLGKLASRARSMDNTRLISAALEQRSAPEDPNIRTIGDPFADSVDILSFNQYIGWYDGLPAKCRDIRWKITQNKPVVISEFGADAKFGYHADSLTRFSEEYQEYLYNETLAMLNTIPQLSGISPWILVDFRSPRRPLPKIQDGWNRKGLISENGEKKKAFFILQKYYSSKAVQQ
ncbi:MAG: beta-glucuronidase [Bacteroidetes bacterium]|nr:beta-glucuronidase [Bacteroidota bacterium]